LLHFFFFCLYFQGIICGFSWLLFSLVGSLLLTLRCYLTMALGFVVCVINWSQPLLWHRGTRCAWAWGWAPSPRSAPLLGFGCWFSHGAATGHKPRIALFS
jgi:hypothetical protein